ncbi:MAG: hypothetical protein J1F65_04950 [Clostridiales bacterium]|nr:hypothetical protein [Clostridiales bacterium]
MKKVNSIIIGLLAVCLAMWIVLCILLGAGVIGVGPQGPQGPAGSTGSAGSAGSAGKSAFEIFKQYHPDYTGTEEEWLESLKGSGSRGTSVFSGEVAPEDFAFGVELIEGDLYMQLFNSVDKTGYVIHRYENIEGVLQWVVILDLSLDSEDAYDSRSVIPINNAEELLQFAQSVNSGLSYKNKTVKLMNDVDFEIESGVANHGLMTLAATNATAWTPIGTKDAPFEGTFDGNGKTISNINCGVGALDYAGFIGCLENGAIYNLTLENVTANGRQVGAFVGRIVGGTIGNVALEGEVRLNWLEGSGGGDAGCGIITGVWAGGNVSDVDLTQSQKIELSKDGMPTDLEDADNFNYFGKLEASSTAPNTDGFEDNSGYVEVIENYTVDNSGNWTIKTTLGLQLFAQKVNGGESFSGKTVTLANDIDLIEYDNWDPIGTNATPFSGIFDGDNHTVSNLKIERGGTRKALGLFGYVGKGTPKPVVRNLTVHNVSITVIDEVEDAYNPDITYVGGVVGESYVAEITNVKVTGLLQISGGFHVGGILGTGYVGITNCHVDVESGSYISTVYNMVGGIVGFIAEGNQYIDTVSVNNISLQGSTQTGGVVGVLHYGDRVSNATVTNTKVTITHSNVAQIYKLGGIAGTTFDTQHTTVENCSFEGELVCLNSAFDISKISHHGLVGAEYNTNEQGTNITITNSSINGVFNDSTALKATWNEIGEATATANLSLPEVVLLPANNSRRFW